MIDFSYDNIPRFSAGEIKELTAINPEMDIQSFRVEELEYIKVLNFLKNPIDLRNFISIFPSEDKTKSILDGSDADSNSSSMAPGFQAPVPDTFFKSNLSIAYYNILKHYHMIKYDYSRIKWNYYTNCCYPGMPSYCANYRPHTDPFSFALNLFLTENEESYTDFFRYKLKNNSYNYRGSRMNLNKNLIESKEDDAYNDSLMKDKKLGKWIRFESDDKYERYHSVSADFNSLTIYKGDFYHSIGYDVDNHKSIRYSLVGAIA
jgi:hypothetical protein